MRKIIPMVAVAALFSAASLFVRAADDAEKEKTIKGEGQCAKCELKEKPSCQNVIVVKEDGKEVKYYLAKNTVSTKYHKNICMEKKKVKAVGTVKEEDGKKVFTASKIETIED